MENVTEKFENGLLTILLSGHIDSSNSEAVETEINNIAAGKEYSELVLDIENLQYISSAGLRIILRLRKDNPGLHIINASSEVYEIFDMTGFSEMIKIEKAYKRISVEGCEVIGQGANGKVYRIDRDTVVKQYINPDSLSDIQRERDLAKKAFIMGIPTAIPYDIVKIGEGYGSVFELLNAESFAKIIIRDPSRTDEIVDLSIDLLKKIHATELKPGDMPDMRENALIWAQDCKKYLEPEIGEKLYRLVEDIPVDYHMMHGDFHLKNVMLQNGEVLLIDMDTLCTGNPIFELGQMFNAYIGFSEADHDNVKRFLGIDFETSSALWRMLLTKYLGTEDKAKITEVENKARIVGYSRLIRRRYKMSEDKTELGKAAIDLEIKEMTELVAKIDSLTF